MIGPFVGRRQELAQVADGLAKLATGEGEVFLVSGEPGIGKSRLAAVVAREATSRGLRVASARCWEGEGAPAYWPWIQILEALGEALPDGPTGASEAADARFAMFTEVTARLAGCARQAPTVLVFDDLHWADIASLLLLEYVVRTVRSLPIVIIGTYRDFDVRLTSQTMRHLAAVAREATCLALQRFSGDEIAALAAELGVALSPARFSELLQLTEGNPLFVDHMVRRLPASGTPPTLRAALRDRLGQVVGEETRELLAIVAVAGREAPLSTVARVAGLDPSITCERLAPAVAAGVLEPIADTTRFVHVLLRDEMYANLPVSLRASIHASLADVVESVDAVAHHALEGGIVLGWERAAVAVLAAGRELSKLAFEDAAELLQRACRRLAAVADPLRLCDLWTLRGRALIRSGDIKGGALECMRAADLARRHADPLRLAEAALARGSEFFPSLVDDALVALLEESLRVLPDGARAQRARVLARLAAALQPAQDPAVPVAMAREAIKLAADLADDDRQAVLYAASSALADRGAPGECLAIDTELARLAQRAGDRIQALRVESRLVFDHMEAGDLVSADIHIETYAELLGSLRVPRYCWPLLLMRAMRALFDGRLEEVDRLHEEARAYEADVNLETALSVQRVHRLLAEQRFDEAAVIVEQFAAMGARAPRTALVTHAFKAWLHVRRGDHPAARAEVAQLRRMRIPLGDLVVAKLVAEPYAHVGEPEERAQLRRTLLPHASGLVSYGQTAMVVAGPVGHLLELLAAIPALRVERAKAPPAFALRTDGDCFCVESDDAQVMLNASLGLRLLAQLVEHPAVSLHVLTLMPGDGGDAGELLDSRAVANYRARAESLRSELAEAESFADPERAARLRAELEQLVGELARGMGLGGRARRAASGVERARINVQRHVRKAIRAIGAHLPDVGRHLERSVKTGIYCRYDPE